MKDAETRDERCRDMGQHTKIDAKNVKIDVDSTVFAELSMIKENL